MGTHPPPREASSTCMMQPVRVRPWLWWGALLFLLAGMLGGRYLLEESPAMLIEPSVRDLGQVRQGEKLPATFVLTNTSRQPVQILTVQSSCGCTVVDSLPKVLAAGARHQFAAQFATGALYGPTGADIKIQFRSPVGANAIKQVNCGIKAVVQPEYLVSPSSLDFGRLRHQEHSTRSFIIASERCDDLTIERVTCSHPAFMARIANVSREGGRWGVDVECAPRAEDRHLLLGTVDVLTSCRRAPRARVVVRASVQQ